MKRREVVGCEFFRYHFQVYALGMGKVKETLNSRVDDDRFKSWVIFDYSVICKYLVLSRS